MSVSATVEIEAIHPADAEYCKMRQVMESCMDAGVDVPKAVLQFFDIMFPPERSEMPCAEGRSIGLARCWMMDGKATILTPGQGKGVTYQKSEDDYGYDGSYFIELAKLPKGVTKIRIRMQVN